jgi:hypothetical protein
MRRNDYEENVSMSSSDRPSRENVIIVWGTGWKRNAGGANSYPTIDSTEVGSESPRSHVPISCCMKNDFFRVTQLPSSFLKEGRTSID